MHQLAVLGGDAHHCILYRNKVFWGISDSCGVLFLFIYFGDTVEHRSAVDIHTLELGCTVGVTSSFGAA